MAKQLQLLPEDLPLKVTIKLPTGEKQYVLLRTKQGGLLLNKALLNNGS
jgi:hypothetical protein